MSRNRRSRPRRRPPSEGYELHPSPGRPPLPDWMKGVIWQCQRCGALADPLYGTGEQSFCPSCQAAGTVIGEDEKIPSPALYDAWRRKQQAPAAADISTTEALVKRLQALRAQGEVTMKTFTGTYHCATCRIELFVVRRESLRCDRCGGPLAKGPLDEGLGR